MEAGGQTSDARGPRAAAPLQRPGRRSQGRRWWQAPPQRPALGGSTWSSCGPRTGQGDTLSRRCPLRALPLRATFFVGRCCQSSRHINLRASIRAAVLPLLGSSSHHGFAYLSPRRRVALCTSTTLPQLAFSAPTRLHNLPARCRCSSIHATVALRSAAVRGLWPLAASPPSRIRTPSTQRPHLPVDTLRSEPSRCCRTTASPRYPFKSPKPPPPTPPLP